MIILLLLLQLLVLLSYQTFNDLSLRSLIIPETDDAEELLNIGNDENDIEIVEDAEKTIQILLELCKSHWLQ